MNKTEEREAKEEAGNETERWGDFRQGGHQVDR
jgi:hypothetical protein